MLGGVEESAMEDLATWKLHGPVHTVRIEFAEWDTAKQDWQAPRSFTLLRFLPNGAIGESEAHNPDGSVSRSGHSYDEAGRLREVWFQMNEGPASKSLYSYDDSGRLVRVVQVDVDGGERESEVNSYGEDGRRTRLFFAPKLAPDVSFGFGIEGTDQSLMVPGAGTATTVYDEGGQAGEMLFHDAEHHLLRGLVFQRDGAGRLLRTEMKSGHEMAFPQMQAELENVPPKAREAMASMLANLLGPANVTTYSYDAKGRLAERCIRMGGVSESRTTYRYDERGNEIEQDIEDISREMEIDDDGNLHPVNESVHRQNVRFEYRWDAQGNWTEREVWMRTEPGSEFQRSNVERREITYYAK